MEKHSLSTFQQFNEEKFTKRVIFTKGGSTVFVLNFMPGQALPTHKHPGSDVFLQMLQGSGTLTINGEDVPVGQGEIIHSDGDDEFAFKNTGSEPASLFVVLNKTPNEKYAQNV